MASKGFPSMASGALDALAWLARRGADDRSTERVLSAVRTAAGVVPLGGRAPSAALVVSSSSSSTPEDVFLDVLLTSVELPASVARDKQRAALESLLAQLGLAAPSSSDDSASWWSALARARDAYFAARRAFFLVRIELLRIASFQTTTTTTRAAHPHAQVALDAAKQLAKDGLVDALLDELAGREHIAVPAFYAHLRADLPLDSERQLRDAQHEWEKQLLDEEELLRELLLLALHFTNERVPLAKATQVVEQLLQWPSIVVPDLFSQHSLARPLIQRKLKRVAALGSLLTLKLFHRASQQSMDDEWTVIREWTRDYIVSEAWHVDVDDHHAELCEELTESGVVLVAWAALLAKLYRRILIGKSSVDQNQLEHDLQTVLKASEEVRGFQQVRDVLRCLVFDNTAPSQFSFLKSTQGTYGSSTWDLPHTSTLDQEKTNIDDSPRVAVFQIVGGMFVDDALSALGYVDHVEDDAQLNAMVKLIRPVLANSTVADALLQERPVGATPSEFGSALSTLFHESRASWPRNLLAGLRVLTALCAAAKTPTPPSAHARAPAVQLTLQELGKKRKTACLNATNAWRSLPPDEYLEFLPGQETVVCKRAFSYADDDHLLVTIGMKGAVDQDDQGNDLVQWQQKPEYHSAWETLLSTLEALVDQIQNQPLIAIDSIELETFTAFLELIVQASNGSDASAVLNVIMQQWAHSRLKQWWHEMGLPNGASGSDADGGIPAVLFRNKVSLRVLQTASREDLVAWGVHDRFLREQILSRVAFPEGASSSVAHQQRRAGSRDELERDGLTHLLRMLLGFLDGFVNEHAVMTDQDESPEWTTKQLHFISSILAVLAKLTSSLDICIDVLIHELGGGTEECVQLILKSSRKLFEYHESTAGLYSGLFSTLTMLMNVSRWSMTHEAVGVSTGAPSYLLHRTGEAEFRTAERNWLVATVEFVMEIVATHESWRFVAIRDKWTLLDRCFRIYTTLLTANFQNAAHGSMQEFQVALRQTILSDRPLLMKVLRSASHLISKDCAASSLNDAKAVGVDKVADSSAASFMYPLPFEDEVSNGGAGVLAREALVTTSLRLLEVVLHHSRDLSEVARLLTLPIDSDGTHSRRELNLITLCGGYLAYPLSKNPEIVLHSLRMLRRAVEALSGVETTDSENEQRSIVSLFRNTADLELLRDSLVSLARSSNGVAIALRKELVELLTACLDNQPGFFAMLVLDDDSVSDRNKRLVVMVERFLESSDKLLESKTDVLCSILRFLRHVWLGGVKERRRLHQQIASALRKSSTFWRNLTQVLRVRLPLATDSDDDDYAAEHDDHHAEVKLDGRSGVFASLARGLILEIVGCEWHHVCSDASEHALLEVLESFREEGLYAHWLRTFTRLDYNASRFAARAESVKGFVVRLPQAVVVGTGDGESILDFHEEALESLHTLRWQLEPAFQLDSAGLGKTWRRTQWTVLVASHAAAQIHSLHQWKVFMELYSLQPIASVGDGNDADDEDAAPSAVVVSTSERRKRKESMIASPPRAARVNAPVSPLHPSSSGSYFSGDRTSYGMVQVLSETVLLQLHRHERDQENGVPTLDAFSLAHLSYLVELLVSMLHHQIRVVVRKTKDPKLSATRARDQAAGRLTVARSIELLALVERAARQVFASSHSQQAQAVVGDVGASASQVALWERLAGEAYVQDVNSLTLRLRSSLLTTALLLTRHITTQHAAQDATLDHDLAQRAVVVQVKLTQHAVESIKLCDQLRSEGQDRDTARLFQVSWSLLQVLLDDFTSLTVAPDAQKIKLDAIIALGPLLALLQHETLGLRALFEIVSDRFLPSHPSSSIQQRQACAVLRGVNAIVWNQRNTELCRHVMVGDSSANSFSVLRFFAKTLVPRLRECIDADTKQAGVRGYQRTNDGDVERSGAHAAWCSVLLIASGLLRQLSILSSTSAVWEFMSSAEPLLAAALSPSPRLSRAVVEEQACVLTFLNALSTSTSRRKQWREMLPLNHVVLMEQSRLALRRACVLLGNSSYTAARQREQHHQAQLQKKPRRLSVTAWPLSSSPRSLAAAAAASLTFAHQTLLHEQLEPATASEKRQLNLFYAEMESKLIHVVEQGSLLLLKWIAGVASRAATIAVDGSRLVDEEQLIPLLALVVPSESLTLSCEPSLGHLCIAMEFCVEQLKKLNDKSKGEARRQAISVAANAVQTSALLFLQTYLLLADQHSDAIQEQQGDFTAFFEQLIDELNESTDVVGKVDVKFLQQILQVVQIKI